MTEWLADWQGDEAELSNALAILSFVSLETGSSDLRLALKTLEEHPTLSAAAFRLRGLEGFGLMMLYGPIVESVGSALPLDQTLVLLRVNSNDVDDLLRTHTPESVASHIRGLASAGLIAQAGGSASGLRLAVDYGSLGFQALRQAGPQAADVVYLGFSDAELRRQAVNAIAEHGPAALAMLEKYGEGEEFKDILRSYGPAIITPIARSDAAPEALAYLRSKPSETFGEYMAHSLLAVSKENGQAVIHMIHKDGLDRVSELGDSKLEFQQLLPLYDLIHLGKVLVRGQSPTSGEMAFGAIDAAFVVADVLSLATVQPEGAAASEVARAEVKASVREASKTLGAQAVEETMEASAEVAARQTSQTLSRRLARWWTVRAAGGTFEVLRKMPQALSRMSVREVVELGKPVCSKAGLRLAEFGPMRFLVGGVEIVKSIPPRKGIKYVSLQFAQAGVGWIGFKKMEEYLASRSAEGPNR